MAIRTGRHRRALERHCLAATVALAAAVVLALALAACVGGSGDSDGPTANERDPTGGVTGSPTGPDGEGATGPLGENLCVVLNLEDLVRITDLRLESGTFDGAVCAWVARDGAGTVTMSFGASEQTAAYIEQIQGLDIGAAVTVEGAEDAGAVTVTSGSGSNLSVRVGLVAKVGHRRLSVTLTSPDATLDMVVQLAELVTIA